MAVNYQEKGFMEQAPGLKQGLNLLHPRSTGWIGEHQVINLVVKNEISALEIEPGDLQMVTAFKVCLRPLGLK